MLGKSTLARNLGQLVSSGYSGDLSDVRFYACGFSVMVRTETTDGQWCACEPLHSTEQARWTAARRAEQTAAALNEMFGALNRKEV